MKRSLSTLLLIAMLASLAACGGTAPEVADTTAEGGENTPETTADPLDDELPEMDLGGYEFRFYAFGDNAKMYVPDGENGEVVNDATYKRNRTVEERFNVKITSIDSGATKEAEQHTKLQNMILAGDEAFDVALNFGKHLACESVMGHFLNLYDVEHLNFSKPWWSAQLVEDLTFMDTMYIGSNNLHYEEFAASKVYYFNKTRAADYKLEDPYQLVFDGKWTIDKLVSMTKDIYEDVNGDGKKDKDDFFGMLTTVSHNSWAVVFDIPVWEKEKDSLKCVALNDRMIEAFDIIYSWYYDSQGLYTWKSYSAAKTEMRQMFIDGRGLFTFGFVGDSGTYYRETEVDYGMLPYPKFDEKQEDYRVFYGANSSNMFAIPIFASDPSRTGLIIEALSAEGYKQLIPVYYEIALKDKYLRDDTSIKMLDLITDARTISFSYCYDNWTAGLGFGNCFASDYASSFATFYAGREAIVAARLKEVTEAFADAK